MTLHHAAQPVISVAPDGESATVVSKLWEVAATPGDDGYRGGLLQAEAVLENGQWKLASVTADYRWSAPALGGQPIGQ